MSESRDTFIKEESPEKSADLHELTDQEIESYARNFLGEEVVQLSQEEVNARLNQLLVELSQRDIDGFGLFAFVLPEKTTALEIQSGTSSWAKVYKALFNFSQTDEYKQSPKLQRTTRELENIIEQNPQMVGPVAMWLLAKDIMWRKDVPSHAKGSLMRSMTYALAFFDTDQYEEELLKNLDFEKTTNYTEVAHMLEAVKQFWSSGHESYAEDRVPDFYLRALKKIKETPEANYLLSTRAREILSMLEESADFPSEATDIQPFELAKGTFASTQVSEGITVVPEQSNEGVKAAITNFEKNEKQITPPQWMIDEAIARGETWVTWEPPAALMAARDQLFDEMHQYATVPIEERLSELSNLDTEKRQELLFDYEYLVSRPVREMIQREFAIELKDLSVREQFYFLNYLKRVSVANADTVKTFTSLYGIHGMRTFLSLEKDEQITGDEIVHFSIEHEDRAGQVFDSFGRLLDAQEELESFIKTELDCSQDDCAEINRRAAKRITSEAYDYLIKAIKKPPDRKPRGSERCDCSRPNTFSCVCCLPFTRWSVAGRF